MRMRKIIFLLVAFGISVCCVRQAEGQTTQKRSYFRVFENLVLSIENSQVKGYYYSSRGWPELKFTCLFLIKGKLKNDKRYEITAFWVFDDTKINGEIDFADNAVWIKLDEDPPGCGNVEPFSFTEGVTFEETEKGDWLGVGVVIKEKTYLYKFPKQRSKTKKYLIQNNLVHVLDMRNEWIKVEFRGEKPTRGWLRKGDLFVIK